MIEDSEIKQIFRLRESDKSEVISAIVDKKVVHFDVPDDAPKGPEISIEEKEIEVVDFSVKVVGTKAGFKLASNHIEID